MADAPPAPSLDLEGPLEFADEGKNATRYLVITNTVGARILLLRAGKHAFSGATLERAEYSKVPSIRWTTWRNVLAPGQKTRIPIRIPRTPYGARVVEITVEYVVPSEAFGKAHIKHVVAEETSKAGSYTSRLARGQTQPLLVAMTGDFESAGTKRQVAGKWTLNIKPNPAIPSEIAPEQLTGFRTKCPYFGTLVESRGKIQQVVGTQVTSLGRGSIHAYVQLGTALATDGKVTLRSGSFNPAIAKAFETKTEPNLPYTTAGQLPLMSGGEWAVFEVTVETLPKLWTAMGSTDALRIEPFYGLVIMPDAMMDPRFAPEFNLP